MNGKSEQPIIFSVSICIRGHLFKLISFSFQVSHTKPVHGNILIIASLEPNILYENHVIDLNRSGSSIKLKPLISII